MEALIKLYMLIVILFLANWAMARSCGSGCMQDVSYTSQSNDCHELKLDLHFRQGVRQPLIVFVHGGGWAGGDKRHGYVLRELAERQGYALATVNYRRRDSIPENTYCSRNRAIKVMPFDIARSIKFLIDNEGIPQTRTGLSQKIEFDSSNIAIVGHSAGAHLVALTAANPEYLSKMGISRRRIRGLVLLDGHIYSTDRAVLFNKTPLERYVSSNLDDKSSLLAVDPIYHLTRQAAIYERQVMPPTYIAFGNNSNEMLDPHENGYKDTAGQGRELVDAINLSRIRQPNRILRSNLYKNCSHRDFLHKLRFNRPADDPLGCKGDALRSNIINFLNTIF